jgi:metal-dependent amidase/aminoacylase/carboxypeptidase family protein
MKNSCSESSSWHRIALVVTSIAAIAFAGTSAAADDSAGGHSDTYTWSAELIGFDRAAGTVTVKSRVVNHSEVGDVGRFEAGDAVNVIWSGVTTAAGIRALTTGPESEYDRFVLPATFGASEMDGAYIAFTVNVDEAAIEQIASLGEGDWITAVSPHMPESATEAVLSIRPYSDVS